MSVARRDEGIYVAWKHGASLRELAERHNITPQRVGQVIAGFHPELEDETLRAMHRGLLENLRRDVQEIIEAPGFKLAPNGRCAVDPDGNPVVDLNAKIEAARTQLAVLESARKLDGVDRPTKRAVSIELSVAEQQATESLARLRAEKEAEDRRRAAEIARLEGLRVIRGEIEPPPAAAAEG
jgi:hypothetical protein